MIDTDKYEELLENGMQHRDLWELASELLAEVKRLRAFIDKLYAKDPCFVDSVWEEGDPQSFDLEAKKND